MSSGTLARRPAVLLALGLCAFGGFVTLLGRLVSGPPVEQKRLSLTTEAGTQSDPAFSPDGRQVAYSAQSGDENFHVFVRPAAGGAPRRLTAGSASDIGPVWSPDGSTLAFLRIEEGRAQAILIPAAGGAGRKLAEFDAASSDEATPAPSMAWTNDGKSLAVVVGGDKQPSSIALLSLANGALRRITSPPEGSQGDSSPAVSPDGKTLAFARTLDEDRGDIYLSDLSGAHPRAVTFDNHRIRGIAWTPGGQDLIYASDRGTGWRLWRLPAYGGSPRDILIAGSHAGFPAVAPKGNRLAFTESPQVSAIWRARIGSPDDPDAHQWIRSTARESSPAWSPDGTRIADVSEQTGTSEIWVSDANGGNRTQLTRFDGPFLHNLNWSPDGHKILFETRGQSGVQIYTVPSDGGKVSRLMGDAGDASWSRDGKSIFYSAGAQVWRAAADGSSPLQLTHRFGSGSPAQSVDGKWVYYRNRRSIWRVPAEGGKEEEVILPEHETMWAPLRAAKDGLYYEEFDRGSRGTVLITFHDFASGKDRPVLRIKNGDFNQPFAISPDGKYVLYTKTDRSQTNLVMIENFR